MSARKYSDRLFDATYAEVDLENDLIKMLGDNTFEWISWDYYDSSLELHKCIPDLRLTTNQVEWLWKHGFARCWLRHTDNMETYYSKTEFSRKELPDYFIEEDKEQSKKIRDLKEQIKQLYDIVQKLSEKNDFLADSHNELEFTRNDYE